MEDNRLKPVEIEANYDVEDLNNVKVLEAQNFDFEVATLSSNFYIFCLLVKVWDL